MSASWSSASRQGSHEEQGPTLIDIFVKGYDQVSFEIDPHDPENGFMNTRHSRIGKSKSLSADSLAGPLATYIPDPPCIMPFVEGEIAEEGLEGQSIPRVDEYWKRFAGWLEQWPHMKQYREAQDEFCNLWRHAPAESRLRAFVVVTTSSVGMRFRPGFAEEDKNGEILVPGQCIPVEMIQVKDNNRFIKLPGPAGWVFEYKDGMQVMAEMRSIEVGMWWYKCDAATPVEVRKSPTWDDSARSGFILNPQEIVVVNIRCQLNGYTFFHLFDGRGWVFELVPGALKNDKQSSNVVMLECEQKFAGLKDLRLLKNLVPATSEVVEVGQWTYITNMEPVLAIGSRRYGHFLAPGSVIKVDKRANSSGNPPGFETSSIQDRLWLRLSDGTGWVPQTDENGRELMLLQSADEVRYPSSFQPGPDPNEIAERCQAGVV